ncbi:MAG: amidohydrolase [Lachnospiraceae bacterium]|nr:amidohydrolase [Lachnospiraceae bacterium]
MNTRFYNAKILTMNEPVQVMDGELWVRGNQIIYIGDGSNYEKVYEENGNQPVIWDEEIDCKGNLLMPGFKDAHTHSAMTLLRSYADDMPLQDWLYKQVFPVEDKLQAEDIYHLTKLAVLEYLTSGITGVMEMYLDPYAIQKAFTECGMRNVQVSGINQFGPSLEELENRYTKLNGQNDLSAFMLGFHAEYTCTKELLEQVSAMAHKYKAPIFMHNAETAKEVAECKERYGVTPTVLFEQLGIFDFGGGGYHCVHMEDEDFAIFKKRGLTAVTNPASNLKLASGIAPISRFLKEGIPVAIGTDGPASNNCLDMFREMFLVSGLAKYRDEDAASTDAVEVLKMATVNGARAMGLSDCDTLQVGKKADIIMIDLWKPNMQPIHNIPKNIVYAGSKQNVKLTMIDGKILYENGNFHIGTSPEEIYEKCLDISKRLLEE